MQITTTQKRAIDHYYQELAAYHEKKVTQAALAENAFLVAAHMPLGFLERTASGVKWVTRETSR